MKKLLFTIVILIVAAGAWYLLFGFGSSDEAAKSALASEIVTPQRGNLRVTINSSGKVEPVKTVEVKSKASGEVIELNFEAGDYVERGELLCKIDPQEVQYEFDKASADLAVAKASLETQKRQLERQRQLFERELLSDAELDQAKLQVEQAQAQLIRSEASVADAKKRLDDTVIRAPISGLILRCPIEEGNIISSGTSTVTGGTALMEIAQVDSVYIVALVDETDIGKVEVGQAVEVEADAFPDELFRGQVLRISPVALEEQNVTVFEVTTKVDNLNRQLKSGMNSNVEIVTAFARDALLVPNAAVHDPRRLGMMTGMMGGGPGNNSAPPTGETQSSGQINENQKRASEGETSDTSTVKPSGGGRPGGPGTGQWAGGGRQDGGAGGQRGGRGGGNMDKNSRVVFVIENGESLPRRVVVGASNLDYTQIVDGLTEADSIDATPVSRMMEDREAMRQRMSRWSSVPGLRRN
jgi:HlyD family secretion protein